MKHIEPSETPGVTYGDILTAFGAWKQIAPGSRFGLKISSNKVTVFWDEDKRVFNNFEDALKFFEGAGV